MRAKQTDGLFKIGGKRGRWGMGGGEWGREREGGGLGAYEWLVPRQALRPAKTKETVSHLQNINGLSRWGSQGSRRDQKIKRS